MRFNDRLRFHDGVTRRGNAVFPARAGRDALTVEMEAAESFYEARDSMASFQVRVVSRPPGLRRDKDARDPACVRRLGDAILTESVRMETSLVTSVARD